MGQRANLVLIDDTGYTLFYCHWCANTLEEDLFWGPEFAIPFVTKQRHVGDNGWLDDIWAEGGAIIDRTRHSLLLYGGEDLLYDIPLRRLYLELLQEVWQGWSVRWAYNGILDIANYVQLPHERVLSKKETRIQDVSYQNRLKGHCKSESGHQWKQVEERTRSGWSWSQIQRSAWTASSSSKEVKQRLASGTLVKGQRCSAGCNSGE